MRGRFATRWTARRRSARVHFDRCPEPARAPHLLTVLCLIQTSLAPGDPVLDLERSNSPILPRRSCFDTRTPEGQAHGYADPTTDPRAQRTAPAPRDAQPH